MLQAFGVSGPATPLSGGRNLCFAAGNVVFKPSDDDAESQWVGQLLSKLSDSQPTDANYRIVKPRPLANDATTFVYEAGRRLGSSPDATGQPATSPTFSRSVNLSTTTLQHLFPKSPLSSGSVAIAGTKPISSPGTRRTSTTSPR